MDEVIKICVNCGHEADMHSRVSPTVDGEKGVMVACFGGEGPKALCLCYMDPKEFDGQLVMAYRRAKPERLKEPFT